MNTADPVLEARKIFKIYPNGVRANQGVNLLGTQAEIHALGGEKGAGKRTLMKILYGMEHPTQGQIYLRGIAVHIHNPQDAIRLGIGMVHQNFMLVPSFTAAENLVLNAEPVSNRIVIDDAKAIAQTLALAEQYGLDLIPDVPLENLSVGMRHLFGIIKHLYL